MKRLNKLLLVFSTILFFSACAKEEIKSVDFSKYNDDDPQTNTALDQWLKTTFLDEYNIDVVYRYNRYYHDVDRNVTPPSLEAVRPTMESVLNGYLIPYRKVAGEDFIKKMAPKEWILFGSNSYASDGSVYAGTASAGRRVNLYGINNYSPYGSMLVIHHEFVHILNQLVNIPTDFESISKADYKASWASTPQDTARKYGFVTSYASGSYTEDYAETAAHLLVKGQSWYDNYANSSSEYGKKNLKLKEQNVVNYYTSSLKVDFRALQKEIQEYLKVNATSSADFWFRTYATSLFKTVTMDLDTEIYNKYGVAPAFKTGYNKMAEGLASTGRSLNDVSVRFDSGSQATVRINYNTAAGAVSLADYTFSYSYNKTTGELVLTKVDQAGTEGSFANAAIEGILNAFNSSFLLYFNNKTFTAEWLRKDVDPNDYNNLGAFYDKDNSSNYWYGVLGQTI